MIPNAMALLRPLVAPMLAAAVLYLTPAGVAAQEHVGQYAQRDIVAGSGIYLAQCGSCHGLAGNTVTGVDLRANRFRSVVTDDDLRQLIRTGRPAAGMPPLALSDADLTAVVAFIRAGMNTERSATTVKMGDAGRGRAIVEGKGSCLTCHRIQDRGGRSAPDLSAVGSSRSPASIHLSLIDPTRAMLPLNRPVRATTRDGRVVTGRRLNEDTYTVLIADDEGRLRALAKEDLRDYQVITISPMPSYKDTLSQDEIADVFAYLLSLRDTNVPAPR